MKFTATFKSFHRSALCESAFRVPAPTLDEDPDQNSISREAGLGALQSFPRNGIAHALGETFTVMKKESGSSCLPRL